MKITASSESLSTIAVDAIAVVVYEGEQAGDLAEVDGMTNGLVDRLIELGEIEGKLHEVTSVPLVDGIAAGRLIVVGGGKRDEFDLVRPATLPAWRLDSSPSATFRRRRCAYGPSWMPAGWPNPPAKVR